MDKVLFIFRRDLRLVDNVGLNFALRNAKCVIPCFIFTPEQIERNPYRSDRCLQFMIESLEDVGQELQKREGKLYLFYGKPEEIVESCIKQLKIEAVVVNRDYTPYSMERDNKIEAICKKHQIHFFSFEDLLLHAREETLKSDGKPYMVFTPFYKKASQKPVLALDECTLSHFETRAISFATNESIYEKILPHRLPQAKGGRTAALKILKNLKKFDNYLEERDYPAIDGTTHLSAHLKFTTCSSREVYHMMRDTFGKNSGLVRSLYWREFFTLIAFYFPYVFGQPFHRKYESLSWNYDKKTFDLWCTGNTGFPIVDAGMRELKATGYMHNRVRMITGSFLVKDLHIDWLWGEKYFAQTLIDYDPAINNGNWQWVASTGVDAQPYFRIFNPWAQQMKFDRDCIYIKKWIPELRSLTPKHIHYWYLEANRKGILEYPAPMLDHALEAKKTLAEYKKFR